MTKAATVQSFFSSFGIPAYESSKVPKEASFPYLTYQYGETSFDTSEYACAVNLYYLGNNNTPVNAKVDEIARYIGRGGRCLTTDGGFIWFKQGSPWVQTIDEPDTDINRRYINVTIEFLV